jgi:hypothetical protein
MAGSVETVFPLPARLCIYDEFFNFFYWQEAEIYKSDIRPRVKVWRIALEKPLLPTQLFLSPTLTSQSTLRYD